MLNKHFFTQPAGKINTFLLFVFFSMVVYFLFWGLGYTEKNDPILFILSALAGLFMAFNIGGNDVANSFGTSVGSKTLSVYQALLIAAIFEVSGAVIAGGEVTKTIRSGINDLPISPREFICLMTSALFSAAFWLLFASKKGLPVSTTHSIIGGIVGAALLYGLMKFGTFAGAVKPVRWDKIVDIAASWVLSPVLGGFLSFMLFKQVKKYVLDYNERMHLQLAQIKAEKKAYKENHKNHFEQLSDTQKVQMAEEMTHDAEIYAEDNFEPETLKSDYYKGLYQIEHKKKQIDAYRALRSWVPIIAAISAMMISSMLIFKGLKNMKFETDVVTNTLIILMIGSLAYLATFAYVKTAKRKDVHKTTFLVFSWLQVFSASGFAFSHGANDIANAIGPFIAVIDTIKFNIINTQAGIPPIVMLTFGVSLVVGLWFIGKEVIATVGENIAKMHPASGFSAELSAATVVMGASVMGLPVSSTHILVGAVCGIGLVNKDVNWKILKPIGMAWVITLPVAAIISAIIFLMMKAIFC